MIAVNSRTLSARNTGVQRYTREIISQLPGLEPISPASFIQGTKGHFWEQCILPLRLNNRGLWSPANSGPLNVEKQVVTIHDVASLDHPEWFAKNFSDWYQWFTPKLCKKVRGIITVSEFSKMRLIERCGVDEKKIKVIPNGFNSSMQEVLPKMSKEEGEKLSIQKPYFLVVCSLEPRKNLERLLKAWNIIQYKIPEFSLVIAGESNAIFQSTDLPATKNCVFTGFVEDDLLKQLYQGAYGFVYPSVYEGSGLPVLEAMACQVPVIASNASAIPEVGGDAVLYVNPLDVEDIADAIFSLAESSALHKKLSEKGVERASQFSWKQTADQTNDYLQTLLG